MGWEVDGVGDGTVTVGLRLLGPVTVTAALGGPAVEIGSAKQRAVLAALGLRLNQVVSRDHLSELLWGDDPPASAMVTLRSLMSRLRKALEGAAGPVELVTREPGWTLTADPGWVDVGRFEALAATARERLAAGEPAVAAAGWREAHTWWRGDALADLVDAGYLGGEAARLDELRLGTLEDLAGAELDAGWATDALGRLEAHVEAHPLRERAWGQLMVALYHLGRQADALRAYQRLRTILGEELGIDPTPALTDLEARILRHDPALAPPSPAESPAPAGAGASVPTLTVASPPVFRSEDRTPYVGRSAERHLLAMALDKAGGGSGGLVLIGGEPGIGKTRLAEETAAAAAASGFAVFAGHCYEQAGSSPYVAFVEILEAAVDAAPDPVRFVDDVLGEAAPEIARLLPQLRRRFPDLPAPFELPAAQKRQYLFRCLTDTFTRLCAAGPVMVILDDLQWADEPTLLFVDHLAGRLAGLPLLVVGTYRDAEVGRPLAQTFEDLHRRRLATRLRLSALSVEETGELVGVLAGSEPPPGLVDTLHAATEGNVFFLEEVFRDLTEGAQLFDPDGRFRSGIDVAALDVPEGVRLVLRRRLDRLSEATQAMLTAAAVAGRVFTVGLLGAMSELGGDEVLDALDEAEAAMLIAPTGGPDEYLFAHELVRQTLTGVLSNARRRRAHLRAAQAMIGVWADDLEAHAAEIAHQLSGAGDLASAEERFTFSFLAGRRAMATSAFEEAIAHFDVAAGVAGAGRDGRRAELLFGLGRAHYSLGRLDHALVHWEAAIAEHAAADDPEAVAAVCLEAAVATAYGGRLADAETLSRRGLAAAGGGVVPVRARLLSALGMNLAISGDVAAGDACYTEALAVANAVGDPVLSGLVAMHRSLACHGLMRVPELVETGLAAAAALRPAGEWWALGEGLWAAAAGLVVLGRFDEAAALFAEFDEVSRRLGHPHAAFGRRYAVPPSFYRSGDLDAAAAGVAEELDQFTDLMGEAWIAWSYSHMAAIQFLRGEWDGADEWHRRAVDDVVPSVWADWCLGLRFVHLAYTGRRYEALAIFDAHWLGIDLVSGPASGGEWGLTLSFVEGCFILGERDCIAGWEPHIAEVMARTGAVVDYYLPGPLCERIAALAAFAAGDHDGAEAHFRTALAQAEALPHVLEQAETRRFYAQLLKERARPGDQQEARRLLQEAAEIYSRMGAPRHVEMTGTALNQL